MTSAALPPVDEPVLSAAFAPDLDPLFAPRLEGWLGADVALSIPLPDGRIFWIFGDTLVGRIRDGRRVFEDMPRNTVAMQPGPSADPASVQWEIKGADGAPRTFFSLPKSAAPGKWFWATAGAVVQGELFVFGYGVVEAPGECEALSFRAVDTWMLRVRDISGPPSAWRIEAGRLPLPEGAPWLASAAFAEGGKVYLLGTQRDGSSGHRYAAVLACVDEENLLKRGVAAGFEFWCGPDDADGHWSDRPANFRPLFAPGPSECTIIWDAPRRRYLVTAYVGRRPEYMIASAPALTGPWSEPVMVWRTKAHQPPEAFLYYAFRLHPHLASGPDDIAATYVVNPLQVAGVYGDLTVYYPRFLRLDLTKV